MDASCVNQKTINYQLRKHLLLSALDAFCPITAMLIDKVGQAYALHKSCSLTSTVHDKIFTYADDSRGIRRSSASLCALYILCDRINECFYFCVIEKLGEGQLV